MLEALSDQQHVWLLVAKKLPFTRVTTPFAHTEVMPREGLN